MNNLLRKQDILIKWADRVLSIWHQKIDALGINDTRALSDSLTYAIQSASNGDILAMEFAFNYYGKWVDMGAGKGERVARLWFSKTFLLEVRKLSNILASQYGQQGAIIIKEGLSLNN